MDSKEIRTLRILEEIENNHAITQRDLAKKLDVSLGLVNSFIKRLINKGLFKITTIPSNRIKYILTPRGLAEKTRLTYNYLQYSLSFYKQSRRKIRHILEDFERQGLNRLVMFGTNELAEIAYLSIQETDLTLAAVVSDSIKDIGRIFFGYQIQDIERLSGIKFDVLLNVTPNSKEFRIGSLHNKGIEIDCVYHAI
ncbi:MAG: winged helix-turn-helix transcriptional regulator [Desulfobacteraceae bacterium]|nr:winged helix-turn-helix transcriptional regulator [Desulfobacteraceae bacterium]